MTKIDNDYNCQCFSKEVLHMNIVVQQFHQICLHHLSRKRTLAAVTCIIWQQCYAAYSDQWINRVLSNFKGMVTVFIQCIFFLPDLDLSCRADLVVLEEKKNYS